MDKLHELPMPPYIIAEEHAQLRTAIDNFNSRLAGLIEEGQDVGLKLDCTAYRIDTAPTAPRLWIVTGLISSFDANNTNRHS